ncbi:helix-turn-helix domain-containing protein [Pseudoalteromonas luteoviolacea]|nr:helix-turn-helix domain-containing protein [Pseudoalteromonas luteoviolacea]
MGQKYSLLSYTERNLIFNWFHYQNKTIREIARLLFSSFNGIRMNYYFANLFSNY